MVSVIIPTYNRLQLLPFTLRSLAAVKQPGIDMEIIVVDDASTDDTWDHILVNYPYVNLLENKGKGAAAARNTGLHAAKGEYILYLDSDDLLGEHFFDWKLAYLQKNINYSACYGDYDYFEGEGDFDATQVTFKNKYPLITDITNLSQHVAQYLSGKYIPANAILWRKDFLLKINGHDETLNINQDVDLFLRAVLARLKIAVALDKTKAYIRNHETDIRVGDARNANQKWVQMLEMRMRMWEKLKAAGYDGPEYSKLLSYYIFSRWKILRHTEPVTATRYLEFAKRVHWPIDLRGNPMVKIAGKIIGPERFIKLKYRLLKRD